MMIDQRERMQNASEPIWFQFDLDSTEQTKRNQNRFGEALMEYFGFYVAHDNLFYYAMKMENHERTGRKLCNMNEEVPINGSTEAPRRATCSLFRKGHLIDRSMMNGRQIAL
jgi:hypothetical protein